MSPIPTTRFRLNRSQKRLHKELRIRRKNILAKYKFSPANPNQSPVPEVYQLYKEYAKREPNVLYYQLVRLYRRNFYHLNMGNICIGLATGIAAGEISSSVISLYQTDDHPIVRLAYFLILIILVLIVACYFVFAAQFTLPLFMPDALSETEIEIICELLNIKQYFFIHDLSVPGTIRVQKHSIKGDLYHPPKKMIKSRTYRLIDLQKANEVK